MQIMQTKRFEDISISELCDRLCVPRKSFYRYFSGKDGALAALIDHTLMDFSHMLPLGSRTKNNTATMTEFDRFFRFWLERKALLDALQRSGMSGMLVERSTSHALQERLMPKYLNGLPDRVQELAMTFCVCGLLSMVIQWHHNGYRESVEEMVKVASMMLSKPLIPQE